jgi:hypothetical protein
MAYVALVWVAVLYASEVNQFTNPRPVIPPPRRGGFGFGLCRPGASPPATRPASTPDARMTGDPPSVASPPATRRRPLDARMTGDPPSVASPAAIGRRPHLTARMSGDRPASPHPRLLGRRPHWSENERRPAQCRLAPGYSAAVPPAGSIIDIGGGGIYYTLPGYMEPDI